MRCRHPPMSAFDPKRTLPRSPRSASHDIPLGDHSRVGCYPIRHAGQRWHSTEIAMERKLAAILAVDVVGYSALMEIDEAGTFDRLKASRKELFEPEITKHHGRIFKV